MSIGNVVLEKSIYVMNLLDPNKGKLIIQREDLQKNNIYFYKSTDAAKTSSSFNWKNQNINPW